MDDRHDIIIPPPATDGWLEEHYRPEGGVVETLSALTLRPSPTLTDEELASRARLMALFCHMSILFGVPIFLFLMVRREDPFVLHHAKASGATFALFYGALLGAFTLHSAVFALAIVAYVPALVGVWRAAGGRRVGWAGLGPVGEALFFPLQVNTPASRQLECEPSEG